jgi:SAM-dependent methyltransferase
MSVFLNAACGPVTAKDIVDWFPDLKGWDEVRLDIDGQYSPDIVGDIRSLNSWQPLASASAASLLDYFDGVYCSHVLEHLHAYDIPKALKTFRTVLKPEGLLLIIVPNFEAACKAVGDGKRGMHYMSPAGPIFASEVIYGKEDWVKENSYQRHCTGFTPDLLRGYLVGCGYKLVHLSVDDINITCAAHKLP